MESLVSRDSVSFINCIQCYKRLLITHVHLIYNNILQIKLLVLWSLEQITSRNLFVQMTWKLLFFGIVHYVQKHLWCVEVSFLLVSHGIIYIKIISFKYYNNSLQMEPSVWITWSEFLHDKINACLGLAGQNCGPLSESHKVGRGM